MRKKTILLADNNPDFLKSRAALLGEHGYLVILASTIAEAQAVLQDGRADLAILDIRLVDDRDDKDVSGLKLARETARSLPKIMMTSYPSGKSATDALKPQLDLDGLPAAVEFFDKNEQPPEMLLEAVNLALGPDLVWLRSLRNALGGMDDDLAADYKVAQKQANSNYRWALIFAIVGAILTFVGVALAFWLRLEVVVVSGLAGLMNEMIGYLFYRRVDRANDRMDHYHQEKMQGKRFEILLKACEGLDTASERETCRKEIILSGLATWIHARAKITAG